MRATNKQSQLSTPDAIRHELLATVESLLPSVVNGADVRNEMQYIRDLLSALPLTTEIHGAAMNHSRNVDGYLAHNEMGAARYELKLLAGRLR